VSLWRRHVISYAKDCCSVGLTTGHEPKAVRCRASSIDCLNAETILDESRSVDLVLRQENPGETAK
jgi:hypothetical protein